MKKIVSLALTAAMALSVVSCSSDSSETQNVDETEQTEAAESVEETQPEAGLELPNPWQETDDILVALEGSGISDVGYPTDGSEDTDQGVITWETYRYSDGVIELRGYIGTASLTYRKALDSYGEDISGDYNNYSTTYTRGDATCRSYAPDAARVVTWQADGYSYSITVEPQGDDDYSYGLTDDTVNYLLEAFS